MLYQGDLDARDWNGWDPLYYASQYGHPFIVLLLLNQGADVNNLSGPVRWTPLMIAPRHGQVNVVRLLFPRQAQLDLQDVDGETALYMSPEGGHPEVAQLLLEKGADPTIAKRTGGTPLDRARRLYHHTCVRLLENASSQPIRVRLFHKLRSIHEAEHAITKAYDEGKTRRDRRRKSVVAAPAYLKRRVEEGEGLPVVEVKKDRRGGEEEKIRAEVMQHVVMEGKVPSEVVIELMTMMLPK